MKNFFITSKVLFSFIVITLIVISSSPISTQALSQEDIDAINNGWNMWVPDSASGAGDCTSVAGLSPGDGTPTGITFPDLDPTSMATAINAYINLYSNGASEFAGLGSTIVADGQHSNVSPFLLVAIAEQESGLGSPTDYNVIHASNSFGRTATGDQPTFMGAKPWYKWVATATESGVQASVDYTAAQNVNAVGGGGDEAAYIRQVYGADLDSGNLTSLISTYDPGSTDYAANVQNTINEIASNISGSPSATPVASPVVSDCAGSGTPAGLANFVYYNQCDPTWGSDPYGDDSPQGTICEDGCGATSVAMVIATLADGSFTPIQSAALNKQLGEYTANEGTDWSYFADGPEHYGLHATGEGTNINEAIATLNAGGLVIAAGTGAAPFTTEGHVIVIKGIAANGDLIVADPASQQDQNDYTVNDIVSNGLQDLVGITQ